MSFYKKRLFPKLLDWASGKVQVERLALLAHAEGRVLELGMGTGISLGGYPAQVTQLVGVEPELGLLRQAQVRAGREQASVQLLAGVGERLPFADHSFDTVVCCLVLCSVSEPVQVLRELTRVLKPNGALLVFEHQRSHGRHLSWLQDHLNGVWNRFSCGCQLNRPTAQLLHEAGFDLSPLQDFHHPRLPAIVAPVLYGKTRRTLDLP